MINRIGSKLDQNIPLSQAAYRPGRGTTEQVFALKMLAEKATAMTNFTSNILMMDMSRAFDTIDRDLLLEDLHCILEPDELHMVRTLLEDVKLSVRIGNSVGKAFKTTIGTPQGDCLSPNLFTLYLAKALEKDNTRKEIEAEHNYSRHPRHKPMGPAEIEEHGYAIDTQQGSVIELQYADDISWITSNSPHLLHQIKAEIPPKLQARNLTINPTKTEEYEIKRGGDESWKKCKYLGSMIDTEADISRRKNLSNIAMNKLQDIFKHKRLHHRQKLRIFNALVASIFLYNSELWTVNKSINKSIDSYQRRLLRVVLNIIYPNIIKTEELYRKTRETPWSNIIQQRRLRWLGHLLRLPEDTPAREALEEYRKPARRPRGGQKTTWLKTIQLDLNEIHCTFDEAQNIAQDRKEWRGVCKKLLLDYC